MHKLKIVTKDGCTNVFLDDFEVDGVVEYELKSSANDLIELKLKIVVQDSEFGTYNMTDEIAKNSKRRAYSKVFFLPVNIKEEVDRRLLILETYEAISNFLKSSGYSISSSAIGRYAIETGLNTPR